MVDKFPIQRTIIFQIKIWKCLANCEKVQAQVKQTVSWLFATFWIPAKPAVDNLDVHLDVHLETVPEVHEQVLTQQSPDCLVTPAEPAIRKEPAEPAAKYTQESNWTSCRTPAEPAITEEPTEPVAKYT